MKLEQIGIRDPPLSEVGIEDMKTLGTLLQNETNEKIYKLDKYSNDYEELKSLLNSKEKFPRILISGMHRTLETLAYFFDSFNSSSEEKTELNRYYAIYF